MIAVIAILTALAALLAQASRGPGWTHNARQALNRPTPAQRLAESERRAQTTLRTPLDLDRSGELAGR